MTQSYDVLHASKQFQDWLMAIKERAMFQTRNQSQAMSAPYCMAFAAI
jgi:hypothetical protein